jgi:hypothetical protein
LGVTSLTDQIVNIKAQVNNLAVANVVKLGGVGTLTKTAANQYLMDLGSTVGGLDALVAELGVVNAAEAPADDLAVDFTLAAADFSLAGFDPLIGLTAGSTNGGLTVELASSTAGVFNGQITLQPRSTNPNPFSMALDPITIFLTGEIRLAGDYNADGIVDAADYVVWRDGLGTTFTQADYDVWRDHFGQTAGAGMAARSNATVPEPPTFVLFILAATGWSLRRGRATWEAREL